MTDSHASIEIRHRFSAAVEGLESQGEKLAILRAGVEPLAFTPQTAGLHEAVKTLSGDGVTRAELIETAGGDADSSAAAGIAYYLERFSYGRLLEWTITLDGAPLVTLHSHDPKFAPNEEQDAPAQMALSRFAWIRREGEALLLESATSRGFAILSARAAALIGASQGQEIDDTDARALASALWRFGFFEDTEMAETPARRTWQFHDKLMHEVSRWNRHTGQIGASYRFKDEMPSAPAIKPPLEGEPVTLPEVDEAAIARDSASLVDIMGRRQSGREFGGQPLTVTDLSAFLARVARITGVTKDPLQDLLSRPYPSGGSIHEMEFYIAVRVCEGLEPGVYHYQSDVHRLVHLPDSAAAAERMHFVSAIAMGQPEDPADTVVVLASRVPRMAWKYEAMAYRATLFNAGVIYQTMYLVATDMGLQGCANGVGDSRIFAEVTGQDPFEETSIAEFALSGPADAG
jgi:SagB-type dehydrogenase family enzyme